MIEFKRILHPTDFSENSVGALRHAADLAEKYRAQLHLLHVVPDPVKMMAVVPFGFSYAEMKTAKELREEAAAKLREVAAQEWVTGHGVIEATRIGVDFVEITKYAREQDVDLIVMGTHGRTGLAHVVLGSVAERVLRSAPCPVLTVRAREFKFVMP